MTDLTNQEKLEEVYRLTLENNHLLHKIQTRGRITTIFQIIYWLAIVGALGGAYLYVKPFYEALRSDNSKAKSFLQQFEQLRSQFPETKAFQNLFQQIKDGSATETMPTDDTSSVQ